MNHFTFIQTVCVSIDPAKSTAKDFNGCMMSAARKQTTKQIN